MTTPKPKRKISKWWIVGGVAVLLVVGVFVLPPLLMRSGLLPTPPGRPGAAKTTLTTGEVSTITAIASVDTSGAVQAQQIGSVYWQTTGQVATVLVKTGDTVKKGMALMTLDPATAPQNVLQAQADLLNAQKALDDLQHPTALSLANAQQAVAAAQDQLVKTKKDLRNAQNPVGQNLYDTVDSTKLALSTAQANAQLANVSTDVAGYNSAKLAADQARYNWQSAVDRNTNCNCVSQQLLDGLKLAYDNAFGQQLTYELRVNTDKANKSAAVDSAQKKYNDAVANLNYAQLGPDAVKVALAQAKVTVAEASLADAQDKLATLQAGPKENDVKSAQVRVQVAQATLGALTLHAPFDGEVLVINYQPGDAVTQGQAAVVVANRAQMHVDASVDESDVSQITVGDPVTLTFDSLANVTLAGVVAWINPVGQTTQGLVRYTVRVDAAQTDPHVLLGMTANVNIVTDVKTGALAVPLDAVQLDNAGEFVNRVNALGALERVNVVSGAVQGDVVIVTGDLRPGDKVELVQPKPTNSGSPFGGG
jgi:HlyD family secretion protein